MPSADTEIDILLVEDNPDDADLVLYVLSKYNLTKRVKHISQGDEALNYLLNESNPLPSVVFLDVKLPKLNGLEILRELRQHERTAHLPVVMLTSSSSERDIRTSYTLGANSYVVKPIDFEAFESAVRNLGFYWLLLNQRFYGLADQTA